MRNYSYNNHYITPKGSSDTFNGDIYQFFKPKEFDCQCTLPPCNETSMHKKTVQAANYLRERALCFSFTPLSAFRCVKHNRTIGGAFLSNHLKGEALDIPLAVFTLKDAHELKGYEDVKRVEEPLDRFEIEQLYPIVLWNASYALARAGFGRALFYKDKYFVHADMGGTSAKIPPLISDFTSTHGYCMVDLSAFVSALMKGKIFRKDFIV